MAIKSKQMKRNWFKAIVGGISLTSAMFVFQACYGTPQDFGQDLCISGKVVAKSTGLPIAGIKVSVENDAQYQRTDEEGAFCLYTDKTALNRIKVSFEDIDGKENGSYASKDTLISNTQDKVVLNIELINKD